MKIRESFSNLNINILSGMGHCIYTLSLVQQTYVRLS